MLNDLGLDIVADRVFRALLEQPDLDAGEVAERLGLSQSHVDKALNELSDLALLRMSRTTPGRRHPVTMERAIALLVRRQEALLEAQRRAVEQGRNAIAQATAAAVRERRRAPAGVELLVDLDEIQGRMESLVQAAVGETISIVPAIMPAQALEASRQLDAELAERGVTQRVLCHDGIRTNRAAASYSKWMVESGAEVRTAPALPARLLVVDRSSAVVPTNPANPEQGAVFITTAGIVGIFIDLFEHLWKRATPLEQSVARDAGTGLTAVELELLELLAMGLTDEAASKRLGVSLRTVKRRMEDLMRRLDASSRFEAGLKAGQRGWL